MSAPIDRCFNLLDFRALARRRLPAPLFHYLDGGADDEWSMRNNTAAFERYQLLPNCLRDVDAVELTTRVLGVTTSMPVILSPTGMTRLFHHDKELAVARAAAAAGVMYGLSTLSTTSIEAVAATSSGPKMFQIYIFKDRGLTREFVERCKASGYDALCLTVDTPLAGNRERDQRTGMTVPPRFTWASLGSFLAHPHWGLNFLRSPECSLVNVSHRVDTPGAKAVALLDYANSQFDRTITWQDAEWLAQQWGGAFVLKGIQSAADARRAVDIGASAIMISNHGGRQLEGTPAPIDCVRPIRDAIGSSLELIVDGGVRRGVHVIKALALGANACSIGRPYLYALAAAGQAGVARLLHLLRMEIERSLALLGMRSIAEVNSNALADYSNLSRRDDR